MREFVGKDNYGKPKSEYVARIKAMSVAELLKEAEHKIWLSAFAGNNPRSDYHWHVDVIWDECADRSMPELYKKAYEAARSTM